MVVPSRVSGALYGRAIGIACLRIYKSATDNDFPDDYWRWIDPGAMAMIGAGSLLGGVTRLTLAVTVIIVSVKIIILFYFYVDQDDKPNIW